MFTSLWTTKIVQGLNETLKADSRLFVSLLLTVNTINLLWINRFRLQPRDFIKSEMDVVSKALMLVFSLCHLYLFVYKTGDKGSIDMIDD